MAKGKMGRPKGNRNFEVTTKEINHEGITNDLMRYYRINYLDMSGKEFAIKYGIKPYFYSKTERGDLPLQFRRVASNMLECEEFKKFVKDFKINLKEETNESESQ